MKPQSAPRQRPFPWVCPSCGEKAVDLQRFDYRLTRKHDGKDHEFEIKDFEAPCCGACDEVLMTNSVMERVTDSFRAHLGLLDPGEIRRQLEVLGQTQKDLAQATGIASETISRWMSGTKLQSRSLDKLVRLYLSVPEARSMLTGKGVSPQGEAGPEWTGPDGETAPRSEFAARAREFTRHRTPWASLAEAVG